MYIFTQFDKQAKIRGLLVLFLPVAALLMLALLPAVVRASPVGAMEAFFPYNVRKQDVQPVYPGSTNTLYIALTAARPQTAKNRITVSLPDGFFCAQLPDGWQSGEKAGRTVLSKDIDLYAHYDTWFDILPIKAASDIKPGKRLLEVSFEGEGETVNKSLAFNVSPGAPGQGRAAEWAVENILLPVDKDGWRDGKAQENLIYINDWDMEEVRSRFKGGGGANWSALRAHPIGYFSLEIANPALDTGVIRVKSQLLDKDTGRVVPGLRPVADTDDEVEFAGWQAEAEEHASLAMLSFAGQPHERYVLPLYADDQLRSGGYTMKITVEGANRRLEEYRPVTIVARRGGTVYTLAFAGLCVLLFIAVLAARIKGWLVFLQARGVITVSLFAAVAFGGVTLPTTFLDDALRVFLGPFAALATGLLSNTFYYILLTALVVLYPRPGTAALMMLLRWLLGALLLGRVTPVSVALLCTQAVLVEGFLWLAVRGAGGPGNGQRAVLALSVGLADALATYVNMELLMFFYRLYYADWYIYLYVIVCGFIYTALGCWLGYALGRRLSFVTGE